VLYDEVGRPRRVDLGDCAEWRDVLLFLLQQNPQYALKLFSMANPRFILLEENTLRSVKRQMERVEPTHLFPPCERYPEAGGTGGSLQSHNRAIYVLKYPSGKSEGGGGFQEVDSSSEKALWCLFTSGSTGS
jgi:hypothetical protein